MSKREIINQHLHNISADRCAMAEQINLNAKMLKWAGYAMNYWLAERNTLDLVEFCNTGKYPE